MRTYYIILKCTLIISFLLVAATLFMTPYDKFVEKKNIFCRIWHMMMPPCIMIMLLSALLITEITPKINYFTHGVYVSEIQNAGLSISEKVPKNADIYDKYVYTGETENLSVMDFVDAMWNFDETFSENCTFEKDTAIVTGTTEDFLPYSRGKYTQYILDKRTTTLYNCKFQNLKNGSSFKIKYDKSCNSIINIRRVNFDYYGKCTIYEEKIDKRGNNTENQLY